MIAHYQSIVHPLRLVGGQLQPLWAIATKPWHLMSMVVQYVSFSHIYLDDLSKNKVEFNREETPFWNFLFMLDTYWKVVIDAINLLLGL